MSKQSTGSYVYSTLSNDQAYVQWGKSSDKDGGPLRRDNTIVIRGKANVFDKEKFVTQKGVVTPVSNEELARLRTNKAFQRHLEAGYIKIENHREEPQKVAKSMTGKDQSAQLTADDYVKEGKKAPTSTKIDNGPKVA